MLHINSWWRELLTCFNYYITICFLWFSWKFVSLTFLDSPKLDRCVGYSLIQSFIVYKECVLFSFHLKPKMKHTANFTDFASISAYNNLPPSLISNYTLKESNIQSFKPSQSKVTWTITSQGHLYLKPNCHLFSLILLVPKFYIRKYHLNLVIDY